MLMVCFEGGCGDIALFGMPESGVEKWS